MPAKNILRLCGAGVLLLLCLKAYAQQPELVIQTGDSKGVFSLAFSSDAKTVVTGGSRARQWEVQSGRDLGALTDAYSAMAVAGSARADRIAVGGRGAKIRILNGTTMREVSSIETGGTFVVALAFDPEGRSLAGAVVKRFVGPEDLPEMEVRIWDLKSGRESKTPAVHKGYVISLSWSRSGRQLACVRFSAFENGRAEVVVRDVETGAELRSFVVDEEVEDDEGGYSVSFSPAEDLLAAGGEDGLTIINPLDWSKRTLGEKKRCFAVTFSPDGKFIATGGEDGEVALWDAAGRRELWMKAPHGKADVGRIAFSNDGRLTASVGSDGVVKIREVPSGRELQTLSAHAKSIETCFFNPGDGTFTTKSEGAEMYGVWDLAAGRKTANAGVSRRSTFSEDGRWLAELTNPALSNSGGDPRLRVWDMTGGKQVYELTSPRLPRLESYLRWSKDSKFLAVGRNDETVLLLNLESRRELILGTPFSTDKAATPEVAFSPDGRYVAARNGPNVMVWQTESGREHLKLEGPGSYSVRFSPDGRLLADYGYQLYGVVVWDASSGARRYALGKPSCTVYDLWFGPGGESLVVNCLDGSTDVWDTRTGRLVRTLEGKTEGVESVRFSPDKTRTAAGSNKETVTLWDSTTGRRMRVFETYDYKDGFNFLEGGRLLVIKNKDGDYKFWDVREDREETFGVEKVAHSVMAGEKLLAVADGRVTKVYDLQRGGLLKTLSEEGDNVWPIGFSEDGKRLVCSGTKGIKLWDVEAGAPLWAIPADISQTFSTTSVSADGKLVVTGGEDGYVRVWDAARGTLLASLVELGESDWAVVTPDGRFDASPGAFELMHWRIGGEVVAFSQLKERFYEPGLLAKVTGNSREPLRDIASLKDVRLYPSVNYSMDDKGGYKLRVELVNRGGGIGPVQVFVNGKEFLADARDESLRRNPRAARASLAVDLKSSHYVPGQQNSIRVYAWNYDEQTRGRYISSRGDDLPWVPPGARTKYEPEFYALVVGVSEYAGEGLRLKYAAKDAEDVAKAVTLAGRRLFGPERVHLRLLSSKQPPAARPTKENVRLAFEEFKKSKPGDVVFIYFAGHGVTLGRGSDSYLFLTQEARSDDGAALADAALRQQTSVSGEELTAWINRVPALREVMILDTCAAGAFGREYRLTRTLPGDAIRAVEKLKDRTGFHILMGSAADADSYEAGQYGQGLLTYALLQGMRGAALAPGGEVDVQTIFQYAADQVPLMARDIGGIQKPEIKVPAGGVSFPIGLLSEDDRRNIPVASAKPVVLRPVLTETGEYFDRLGLSKNLGEALRGASLDVESAAALVYVDGADIHDAFTPSGSYRVTGDALQVTVKLVRNYQVVATFTAEGRRDDLGALTKRLVDAIIKSAWQSSGRPSN